MILSQAREMSPRGFLGFVVALCFSVALLQPAPAVAQVQGQWSSQTPYWCFKTGQYCHLLNVDQDVVEIIQPCERIGTTGYYDYIDVNEMCYGN